ncbi:glycoside hydrolase [Winogradskyella sp.]|uniref:glycoside hydrolase family 113 n=1 Tax=Winogradskyella sp. TaxID=1883156 RepID=UPI002638B123|nr:glycoside hydrolase [Winogradskyella sp.]
MKCFKRLFLCLVVMTLSSCNGQEEKINGVSFVASKNKADQSHVTPVVKINANYAAVMPFGFIRGLQHPKVMYNADWQWFGETPAGARQYIEELRKQDIKIMVKPQIWVNRGEFTGEIMMTSESDWKTLESTYSKFILEYAELAQQTKAEILCIGTELELFVKYRPEYWTKLIKEIRDKYKGKLTYAANWDEFRRTPFWDQLDFIGVDAYFPVSEEQSPTFETCLEGWKVHKPVIAKLSQEYQKPILFTEYGYRSVDYAGKQPWVSDRSMGEVNLEAQVNTTKALYETFWNEKWFAGGFIWKWFIEHDKVGGEDNPMFTPQNKPVEEIIRNYYKS